MEQLRTVRPTDFEKKLDARGRDVECAPQDRSLSEHLVSLGGYGR